MRRASVRYYWRLVHNAQARGVSFVVFDLDRGAHATMGVDIDFESRASVTA